MPLQNHHRAFSYGLKTSFAGVTHNSSKSNLPLSPTQWSTDFQEISADGQACEWSVHASPDGSIRDLNTGREYPYLFWEAHSAAGRVSRIFGLDDAKSFCVAGDAAGTMVLKEDLLRQPYLLNSMRCASARLCWSCLRAILRSPPTPHSHTTVAHTLVTCSSPILATVISFG